MIIVPFYTVPRFYGGQLGANRVLTRGFVSSSRHVPAGWREGFEGLTGGQRKATFVFCERKRVVFVLQGHKCIIFLCRSYRLIFSQSC